MLFCRTRNCESSSSGRGQAIVRKDHQKRVTLVLGHGLLHTEIEYDSRRIPDPVPFFILFSLPFSKVIGAQANLPLDGCKDLWLAGSSLVLARLHGSSAVVGGSEARL